jgi:hypothetical protein
VNWGTAENVAAALSTRPRLELVHWEASVGHLNPELCTDVLGQLRGTDVKVHPFCEANDVIPGAWTSVGSPHIFLCTRMLKIRRQ